MVSMRSPVLKKRHIDRFGERLKKKRDALSPGLLAVAEYIDRHRHAVLAKSALEIGREIGTSDATVIRAIQALGFEGLVDLKDTLEAHLGETDSPSEKMAATTDDLLDDTNSAIDFVVADMGHAMAALSSPDNRQAMATAVTVLSAATKIGVFGIGASGVVALYASRNFIRSGFPSYALDRTGIMLAEQLLQMETGDVLLVLAQGRPHREVMTTITEAQRLSIPIIAIVGKEDSALAQHACVTLVLPRAKNEKVAMHGASLVCIEALTLALAGKNRDRTLSTLDRLVELRNQIRPNKR
ncbi:MurR/RpiR family transcriptional regulator [Agrobacterium vaccinii]|uniref:MurR/RpiR family transcriptional regulator n=1 Tax=Agrobacterium vaccinii TaxID=2735528 RepID=UPI003BAF4619|nr:MurR/RpiR family transcriptional regulator [Agrobacterium vaccinii]